MNRFAYFKIPATCIRISISALIAAAALMYADFSVFTAMVLISALIHETGHIVFLKAFGCEIRSITLMPFGAVIDSDEKILSYKREAAVALAGAVFNICAGLSALLFFAAVKDIYSLFFALTNFTLAAVNLVPVKTLDGARALEAALYALLPYEKAQKCADTVSYFSFLFLTLGGGTMAVERDRL